MKKTITTLVAGSLLCLAGCNSGTTNDTTTEETTYKQPVTEGTVITTEYATDTAVSSLSNLKDSEVNNYYDQGDLRIAKLQDSGTWQIYTIDESTELNPPGGTNIASSMYLIVDTDEAILIDGGNGREETNDDMAVIMDEFVGDKSLKVIISHSHGDHTGLLVYSDVVSSDTPVYINEDDVETLDETVKTKYTVTSFDANTSGLGTPNFPLTVVEIPAHTEGSVALINYDAEIIFTGDAVGSGAVWLFGETNLVEYRDAIDHLLDAINDMENPIFYCGHRWQQEVGLARVNDVAVHEVGLQYIKEYQKLLTDLTNQDASVVVADYTPMNALGLSSDNDLNDDGMYPEIIVLQNVYDYFLNSLNK